jgi:hypothetical protein
MRAGFYGGFAVRIRVRVAQDRPDDHETAHWRGDSLAARDPQHAFLAGIREVKQL